MPGPNARADCFLRGWLWWAEADRRPAHPTTASQLIVPHALRGNASPDALRPLSSA
ncbi:hypothetical protein PSEUDO8O_120210 [Pseudomonas sp. 8O]|nr:hypothetical protein PSEUDO8O_120210 [Pseudomonas sp. 8O]